MDLPKRAFIRPILRIAAEPAKTTGGIAVDIESLTAVMKKYPWTELQKLKGDQVTLEKIEEAREILENLKDALS